MYEVPVTYAIKEYKMYIQCGILKIAKHLLVHMLFSVHHTNNINKERNILGTFSAAH